MCSHKWDSDYSSLLSIFNLLHLSIFALFLNYVFSIKSLTTYSIFLLIFSFTNHCQVMLLVTLTFSIPFSHSSASKNSFVPSILPLWNPLSFYVKSSSSLIIFKSNVICLFTNHPLDISYHTIITYVYHRLINHTTSSTLILFCLLWFYSVCAL